MESHEEFFLAMIDQAIEDLKTLMLDPDLAEDRLDAYSWLFEVEECLRETEEGEQMDVSLPSLVHMVREDREKSLEDIREYAWAQIGQRLKPIHISFEIGKGEQKDDEAKD